MKVQIKTPTGRIITLGGTNNTKPYNISIEAEGDNDQIITTLDNKIVAVTTRKFIKDLITITDTSGNTVSFDSQTDYNIIYNISPIINVRTLGNRHLGSNKLTVTEMHIELFDNQNKFEIFINNNPKNYEVSVCMI